MINTIFVDVAIGSDQLGDGSQLKPLFSIQAALEVAKSTKMPVVVQIAPGNYTGFELQNFNVPLPTDAMSGAFLSIVGTPVPYVPSKGPSTGLVASLAEKDTDVSTITVTGAGWIPGELNNKFVRTSDSLGDRTIMIPISGNTTDTLELVPGTFSPGVFAGSTFTIMDLGTVINAPAPPYPVASFGLIKPTRSPSAAVRITNSRGPDNTINIQGLKFALNTNVDAVLIDKSSVLLQNCSIVSPGTTDNSGLTVLGSQAFVRYCIIEQAGTGARISGGGQIRLASSMFLVGSVISGGHTCLNGFHGSLVFISVVFRNASSAGILIQLSTLSTSQIGGCVFDNCNIGLWAREDYSSGPSSIAFGLKSTTIKNCSTAGLDIAGAMSGVYMSNVSGDGNGVGIRLTHGAFAGVKPDVTLSGQVEVQIDGVTTNLAAMRAATPKIVLDPNFGSRLYEF